jgi:hypothetical protein
MHIPQRSRVERHRHPDPDFHRRLYVYRRKDSRWYQAETFLDGRKRRATLKAEELTTAFKLAGEWYRKELRTSVEHQRQHPIAQMTTDPVIGELAPRYLSTLSGKKLTYATWRWEPIQLYWRTIKLREIKPATFKDFYVWRRRRLKSITAHTLHKDVVLIRQILKWAIEEELLERLPLIPKPGKIITNPRPWLTASEWEHLKAVSQERIKSAPNARTKQQRIDTDHFMRFMVASCARVDELRGLRFRDCRYRLSDSGKPDVLMGRVTGKRGTRDLVADVDAVDIISTREGKPGDLAFPEHHRDAFRELLIEAGLRRDSHGNLRNFKSLRATAISRLVIAGRDLMFIARNAGTSVTMIDQFYAKRLTAEMSIHESHPIEVAVTEGR